MRDPGAPVPTLCPSRRLLDVRRTCTYLGIGRDSLHTLEANGALRRVSMPGLRRVLFDVEDLNRLVQAWKA
jgi:hypothetical protein